MFPGQRGRASPADRVETASKHEVGLYWRTFGRAERELFHGYEGTLLVVKISVLRGGLTVS